MRRHEWNLSDEQKDNLYRYLDDFQGLKPLYEAKQESEPCSDNLHEEESQSVFPTMKTGSTILSDSRLSQG